jgi:hypothetical protein
MLQRRTPPPEQGGVQSMSEVGNLVGLTPEEALDRTVAYMTQEGASVIGRSENSVTFTYHKGPNMLILLLLLLLFLLPGILYWLAASRDTNFTITASPAEGGCRLLFGGEDAAGDGYYHFKQWVKLLPEPGPTPTEADVPTPPPRATRGAQTPDEVPLWATLLGYLFAGALVFGLLLLLGINAAVSLAVVVVLMGLAGIGAGRTKRIGRPAPTHSRSIPQWVKIAVATRDGGKCRRCGSAYELQYDHIIPYSQGGSSRDLNNIQLLCGRCNRLKSNRYVG